MYHIGEYHMGEYNCTCLATRFFSSSSSSSTFNLLYHCGNTCLLVEASTHPCWEIVCCRRRVGASEKSALQWCHLHRWRVHRQGVQRQPSGRLYRAAVDDDTESGRCRTQFCKISRQKWIFRRLHLWQPTIALWRMYLSLDGWHRRLRWICVDTVRYPQLLLFLPSLGTKLVINFFSTPCRVSLWQKRMLIQAKYEWPSQSTHLRYWLAQMKFILRYLNAWIFKWKI